MNPSAPPRVTLLLPTVLERVVGRGRIETRGGTIEEALEGAFGEVPLLRHHLMLDSGGLRPHILCIVDGESVLRDEAMTTALVDGSEILIHQAISGG